MEMVDLYIKLINPDTPWFDAAEALVHSLKNIERTFLEQELNGETHIYMIHGYKAGGQVITWYELRNKMTGERVGPDSPYGLIDAGDLEEHAEYCRVQLGNAGYSDDINCAELQLALAEPMGTA